MAFEYHDDVLHHPAFSRLSTASFGVWVLAGTITSRDHTNGFVSDAVAADLVGPDGEPMIRELVEAGVWLRAEGGYTMAYGPSSDFPLPVWRYGDEPVADGRLFEIIPDPDPVGPPSPPPGEFKPRRAFPDS